MIRIKNMKELKNAISIGVLEPLFISYDAEENVMDALNNNLEILVNNYGDQGEGGYICVITDDLHSAQEEYLNELGKYNLSTDDFEYDTILGSAGGFEVHIQLFVMTEYHLLFIYKEHVEVTDETAVFSQ